jgi:hypothetical protein
LGERQTEDLVVACSNQAWGTGVLFFYSFSGNAFIVTAPSLFTPGEVLHHNTQGLVRFWKGIIPFISFSPIDKGDLVHDRGV